jgi:hypothetical protein
MLKNLSTAIIAVCSLTANATTVQDMIGICKPSDSIYPYCLGQASGVMATMMANADETKTGPRMCATSSVSNAQAIKIFLNWADKNPTNWQLPSAFGFILALREAYPCK